MTRDSIPTAVIIVSDGLDMGTKELAAAEGLASAFGDNLEIYAVQIGETQQGNTLLTQVVAAGGSGYLKPASMLTTSAGYFLPRISTSNWVPGSVKSGLT